MSYIGTNKIGKMFLGGTEIAKAYLGSNLVYQNKPYDAEIEYLQSSGTQYIDTGIVVADTDILLFEVTPLSKSGDNFITGCNAITNGRGSIWVETYSNATWYVRFGATSANNVSGASVNTKYTVETKKRHFAVNGTKLITLNYNSMPDRTITLFGRKGSSVSKGNHKIHSYAIKDDNGNYRINLIPVRVGTTGYMYDKVSGQLFGNSGTGDFILGNDTT